MNHSDPFQNIFPFILDKIAQDVGDLIGGNLELQDERISQGTLHEIFSPPRKKSVLTRFNLKDNTLKSACILADMDMAIDFGGRLIMLPENEISALKKQGKLEGELLDAFSEIANIISGAVNSTCREYISEKKLHFIKGNLEVVSPETTSIALPDETLSLLSGTLSLNEKKSGSFYFFFPHSLLENQRAGKEIQDVNETESQINPAKQKTITPHETIAENIPEKPAAEKQAEKEESDPTETKQSKPGQKTNIVSNTGRHKDQTRIISIIGQDKSQLEILQKHLALENVEVMLLSPESDLKQYLTHENLCCVFLFIKKVNDFGFSQTIKARTAMNKECPLIVAGPEWTRSKVLKALKYGANDILITPAGSESILKKFQKHLQS